MARTVDDLALLYSIIAGPDGRDSEVQPVPVDQMPHLERGRLRVAFAPSFPGLAVAAEIRDAVEELAEQLRPWYAVVEEATLPQMDFNQDLSRAGAVIGIITGAFQSEEQEHPITLAQYLEALDWRDQSILAWEQFFQEWDVLLCPPSMVTAFPHCEPGSALRVDDQEVIS
jgi:amidase